MKKELSIKQIYDDFTNKVMLNDNEKEVLILYVKNNSIVAIANKTLQSTANVSRIIKDIKDKYNGYKKLELAKLKLLQ